MGADESKFIDANAEQRHDMKMRPNADMGRHSQDEHPFLDEQNNKTIDDMSQFLLVLVQSTDKQNMRKNDRRQISINGISYTITDFINKGGFGEVYKAESHHHNKDVAIKIMINSPDIRQEVENEIKFLQLTKSIPMNNHPVIEYYGCEIRNEGIFLAMELAICDLLTFWFNQINDKTPKEKFYFGLIIIVYVLRALTFLEKLNIIHGDIKPQNLVIVRGNRCFHIKLIDFGTVEKMSTCRHQLTVDVNKAYTIYFASPEFVKRDSNHLMKRHLNKKSDAWAAGVMFYFLFFQNLPWKNEFEYENFCNDRHAKDVVVPQRNSFKLIIELLLKKNPEERSSAKATLMQIKSHPHLSNVIPSIENTFYPIDDVCRIIVPNHIKQQLEQISRPGHIANVSHLHVVKGSGSTRRSCWFGKDCYRRDRDHHEQFAHPNDPDFQRDKIQCRYGAECYRTDREHHFKYLHPPKRRSSSVRPKKQKCRYADKCNKRSDPEHNNKFDHN